MNRHLRKTLGATLIAGWVLVTLGCASSGSSTVHYGYYGGDYWHDPYYGRCCYGDVDIDIDHNRPPNNRPPNNRPPSVRPRPPVARPPIARPPIARPPGMRPPGGIPSRPRPTPRPRPVHRGRRR